MAESAGYVERRRAWLDLADEIANPHGITGRQLVAVLFAVKRPDQVGTDWNELFKYVECNNFATDINGGTDD
mgnify:CR=1 FL=1